jgi:hypothetical protein
MVRECRDGRPARFTTATRSLKEIAAVPAGVVVEQAEWLASEGRIEEAGKCAADARRAFERLQAEPWLARVERLQLGIPEPLDLSA